MKFNQRGSPLHCGVVEIRFDSSTLSGGSFFIAASARPDGSIPPRFNTGDWVGGYLEPLDSCGASASSGVGRGLFNCHPNLPKSNLNMQEKILW